MGRLRRWLLPTEEEKRARRLFKLNKVLKKLNYNDIRVDYQEHKEENGNRIFRLTKIYLVER